MAYAIWYGLSIGIVVAGIAAATWALMAAGGARGKPRCPGPPGQSRIIPLPRLRGCWYDLSGAESGPDGTLACPECGFVIRKTKDLYRRRRRWGVAAFGLLLILAGAVAWSAPMLRAANWYDTAPTTLLAIMLPENVIEQRRNSGVHRELLARARRQELSRIHVRLIGAKLAGAMDSSTWWRREVASAFLIELERQAAYLEPQLLKAAEDAPPAIEWARVFGAVGSEACIPYLLACHREAANSIVSTEYARALAILGGEEALRELLSAFEDKPGLAEEPVLRLRLDRLLQLGFFGGQAGDLLAEAEILLDPASPVWTPEEQLAATAVLRVLRGDAEHISIALVDILDEQSTESHAAPLLRRLGRDAAPAASALGAAAESWSRRGRDDDMSWAVDALRAIGHPAVPVLRRLSTCGDGRLEAEARSALQAIRRSQ